jgi:hypothetical protein
MTLIYPLVFLVAYTFPFLSHGQDSTYLVKAGQHPAGVIPDSARFLYPQFRKGVLFFPKGVRSEVMLLNYDLLYSTMQLINSEGDTLALDESANIAEFVRIESDLYFRDMKEGYFLILTKDLQVRLMVRIRLTIFRRENVVNNGYGISTQESNSSRSARRSPDNGTILQYENVYFRKDYDYYLLGAKNKIYKANKSSINRLFPDNKQEINNYLSEGKCDFNSEHDLKQLITFCNGLSSTRDQE